MLAAFLTRDLAALTPAIRNNLRMGAYQLLETGIAPHAVLHEAVTLARRFGHAGVANLTNAVLRRIQREGAQVPFPDPAEDPVRAIAVRQSLPDWIVAEWVRDVGVAEAARRAEDANHPLPLSLRVNTLRTSRDALLSRFHAAGLDAEPSPVVPEAVRFPHGVSLSKVPGFDEGLWYVQGEAAMLASRVVGPRPGDRVADLGAAPGGKSTHLAALMQNQGLVLAVDSHAGRLGLVVENTRRLGTTIVATLHHDATEPLAEAIDRLLLDAPCSGLGVLYRKADLRWRLTPGEAAALPDLQGRMLEAAARSVRPGGVLVYATCTVRRAENEDVVRAFNERHPDFRPADLAPYLPEAWREDAREGMIQLVPHRHGVEGFFLARWERTGA